MEPKDLQEQLETRELVETKEQLEVLVVRVQLERREPPEE